ncbi:hypothetical protein EfmJHP36_23220 [Enterococcus faecium]|nr:hypothetical protein EfmJHP36_23220 [Enterococcus faecium]
MSCAKSNLEYPMEELRKKMGLVLQDAFLFYGDIAGNIPNDLNPFTDDFIVFMWVFFASIFPLE